MNRKNPLPGLLSPAPEDLTKAVSFAIGSTTRKPIVGGSEIQIREVINMTAIFNHDAVDGAPAARFINQLRRYIERDYQRLL